MRLVTSILFLLSSNCYLVQVTSGQTEERSGEENDTLSPEETTEIGLSYEIEEGIENQVREALSNHFNESFSGLSNPELFVRYLGKTYGEKGIKKVRTLFSFIPLSWFDVFYPLFSPGSVSIFVSSESTHK